jgi:hypothetical protein
MSDLSIRHSVEEKKLALASIIREPLCELAVACGEVWPEDEKIDAILKAGMSNVSQCKLIYAWGRDNHVISAMISPHKLDRAWRGRNLSERPYLKKNLPFKGIMLSSVYISEYDSRRTVTALQAVNPNNHLEGFIAADFNVSDLLQNTQLQIVNSPYTQYRGDPAVRGTLFQQQRVLSEFDTVVDAAFERLVDMITDYGVFHAKILFSSSRCSLWFYDDPYQYQLLNIQEVMDDDLLLAYPERGYPERAIITPEQVKQVCALFKALRYIDDTIYLRSSSINIINGMVGLTFSCDGSHYMMVDEFLDRDVHFWMGLSN